MHGKVHFLNCLILGSGPVVFTSTATDHVVTVTTQPPEGDIEQLELQNAMSEGKLGID